MQMKKLMVTVVLCLFALSVTGCSKAGVSLQKPNAQEQADKYFDSGEYEKARELYKELGLDEQVSECSYLIAKNYLEKEDYVSAIEEFETIVNYKDVAELLKDARYKYGISLYDQSKYTDAIAQFTKTTAYMETESYLEKCKLGRKYEKFDYDGFLTEMKDLKGSMPHEEIIEYVEKWLESYQMYTTWYPRGNGEKTSIDKYCIDGKEYTVLSMSITGDSIDFDISYVNDATVKSHMSITRDLSYNDVTEETLLRLSIGNTDYANYSKKQEKKYKNIQEENEMASMQLSEAYLPGSASSYSLSIYVYCAYWRRGNRNNPNQVVVNCTIMNNFDSNLDFVASDYFSLNTGGIITYARESDYDYNTIAPGGSFSTELAFDCPDVSRLGNLAYMTLLMEDAQIHLSPAPQSDKEQHQLPGTYMASSPSFDSLFIITDAGDGTYNVLSVSDITGITQYEGVKLKKNNKLSIGNGDFLWSPDDFELYYYDPVEEKYDKSRPYIKQNPII